MLTKEQASEFNSNFWGAFHKKMRGVKSSNGRSISWLNYPTDVKKIFLRLEVDKHHAAVNLDFQYPDPAVLAIVWEQMHELKPIMETTMGFAGNWNEVAYTKDGLQVARISWEFSDVNLYQPEDHERIYAFFESILVKFDLFYQEFKEILIHLIH